MFIYRWFFKGIVQEIIDGRTLKVGIDIGFQTWKNVLVKFNRITVFLPSDPNEKTEIFNFLETNLKRKKVFLRTFQNKDKYENIRYFAEVYLYFSELPEIKDKEDLTLRDINMALKTSRSDVFKRDIFKIEGLTNINDYLVKKGLAKYVDFTKDIKKPEVVAGTQK